MSFLWWILKSSVVQTFALNEVRHGATWLSGVLLAWLLSHHASQTDATNIVEGLSATLVGLAGYAFSEVNASNNKAVVEVAAATGQVVKPPEAKAILAQGVEAQRAADQKRADDTQAAVDAADKADSNMTHDEQLARLRDGTA